MEARRHLIVLGCSFAALEFLYRTVRRRGAFSPGACTVVEPAAVHTYLPLSHEVASGVARVEDNTYDAAAFVRSIGATRCPQMAVAVDPARRVVELDEGGPLAFDQLIIAVGSVADNPAWPNLYAAKQTEDAVRLHAVLAPTHSIAIIGGGITGVEWAAELASRARVVLISATPDILPSFSPGIRRHAARRLAQLGVEIRTGEQVSARPVTDFVVWAGGVRANPMLERCGLPLSADGHLIVDSRLGVAGYPGIYGLGDAVRPSSDRAIEAIWQGAWLAKHLGDASSDGPPYESGRTFFFGISLGRGHSMILRGRWWADVPLFVSFRRWLRAAYYARFTVLRRRHALEHTLDRRDDLARRAGLS